MIFLIIVVVDGSSFAERISCLKFESKVSNFPVIKAILGFYHEYYYEKSLWVVKHILEYVKDNDFSVIVVVDGSSFAERISCLKFEPKVSNFPVIKATLGFYHQYYCEKSLGFASILEFVK